MRSGSCFGLRMAHTRTVLLDVDGTLVDSNDLHAEAWCHALEQGGFAASFAQVRPLIGMGGDKVTPLLTGLSADSEQGKQLGELRSKLFRERYLPRVQPFPDARKLLEALLERGHNLVIATSAKGEELTGLLERGGIADLLPVRTSSDDADGSKPDPDIVLAALQKAGVQPEAALMLGDTPYDLQAATQAGVGFVGLRSGGYDDAALVGALAVYADPSELRRELARSPFG